MDIQTRKLEFIQEFLKIKNEELILQLEKLLKSKKSDNLEVFSIDDLNLRIENSEKDFELGKFKTSTELLSKYK